MKTTWRVLDGNEATADIAYRTNEICAIYPITPASSMGELADSWSAHNRPNIWNNIPEVVEMQSEGGVAGTVHGAVQAGALTTTFTSSQGLLLMIPNMYRIAAELSPTVFHVASRAVAPHGMTIYCEHSDVMAVRQTGFAIIASANVQEAHDLSLITQAASLKAKIPFVHFFDGMKTSHEVSKIAYNDDTIIKKMIDAEYITELRNRKLSPQHPYVRGVIYNNDIFFQAREAVNPYYEQVPTIITEYMQRFHKLTGRKYEIIEYYGAKDAKYIIVTMASGSQTVLETIEYLNKNHKTKLGLIQIRLFTPFANKYFLAKLPKTCKKIAVLDRTKEPGSNGEPLYQAIVSALMTAFNNNELPTKVLPKTIRGRFGIGGKEFTPAMVRAIFQELQKSEAKSQFTIGINDNVSNLSLAYDSNFNIEPKETLRAIIYGLGADGTISANKNTLKIIGENTTLNLQGYFQYDPKKSGSLTASFLRFSKSTIHANYLINSANFISCSQFNFLHNPNIFDNAAENAILLVNSSYGATEIWQHLLPEVKEIIATKHIQLYAIDAYKIAKETKLNNRINTIMQTCFFALTKIMPMTKAIKAIKNSLKTYAMKGKEIITRNSAAIDKTLGNLVKVVAPTEFSFEKVLQQSLDPSLRRNGEKIRGSDFITKMLAKQGDQLPVSAIPADGTYQTNTTKLEKINSTKIAPIWNPDECIQCGNCSLVCPHAVLRSKKYHKENLRAAPKNFKSAPFKTDKNFNFTIQCFADKCTNCSSCVNACPIKDKALQLGNISTQEEQNNADFFVKLENITNNPIKTARDLQFLPPFFEFPGACAGCGETPYIKLLTQLFGERLLIANACGCSSVYGGILPTSPWAKNKQGYGPAWSSSLFEDNAEFGFGFLLTTEKHKSQALQLLQELAPKLDKNLIISLHDKNPAIEKQRENITALKNSLKKINDPRARQLSSLADQLINTSVWAIGGDGWAYDIGFGGLDHVLASGRNINLLVLDTEVYSNTGGQASKATPRAAVAKFAANGNNKAKKDLGYMAMHYPHVYVASIALGANSTQAIQAFCEAENYNGPSLIIAYSHCIAHGIDMQFGMQQQKLAVQSGYWILYRYNPSRKTQGLNPLQLDSKPPTIKLEEYLINENRFKILMRENPKHAENLLKLAQQDVSRRWERYQKMART